MRLSPCISSAFLTTSLLFTACKQETSGALISSFENDSLTVPHRPKLHHDTQTEKSYKQVLVHDESDEEEKLTHIDSPSSFVDTLTIDMQQVRQGPLGTMSGIAKNLVALLGGHGYDRDLLIAYNPELEDLLMSKSMSQISYNDLAGLEYLKTPAIYPSLKDFAPMSLEEFVQRNPQIRDQIGNDQEVVIITRDDQRKVVTLYYDQGQIVFAQYSSPGKGGKQWDYDHGLQKKRLVDMHSPEGILYTNRNIDMERYILQDNDDTGEKDTIYYRDPHDRPNPTRRSRAFNSSMPYFIPVEASDKISGVGFHYGYINGKKLSHGCFRQTGQVATELFERIGERVVKVVVFNLYDKE